MTDRKRLKIWNYALFYFVKTNEVGIAKTSLVMDGYKNIAKDGYVKLHWPADNKAYTVRVLELAGEVFQM